MTKKTSTTDTSLKDRAISLKGKSYVLVKDRVSFFNETYEKGSIKTELISPSDSPRFIVRATVIPDIGHPERVFVAHSQATLGGYGADKEAALENAETSAVGRALGLMGIGVIDSIASVDEMNKAGVGVRKAPPREKKDEKYELIKRLLALSGVRPKTLGEAKTEVLRICEVELEPKNYGEIIDKLRVLAEANPPFEDTEETAEEIKM